MTSAGTADNSVEASKQLFEAFERARFPVHREGRAQSAADAGVNGRRSHLHKPPGVSVQHSVFSQIQHIHRQVTRSAPAGCRRCVEAMKLIQDVTWM